MNLGSQWFPTIKASFLCTFHGSCELDTALFQHTFTSNSGWKRSPCWDMAFSWKRKYKRQCSTRDHFYDFSQMQHLSHHTFHWSKQIVWISLILDWGSICHLHRSPVSHMQVWVVLYTLLIQKEMNSWEQENNGP